MASGRALTTLNSALCELGNFTARQRESTVPGLASGWPLPHARCKLTLRHPTGWMEPGSIPALLAFWQDTFIQGTTYTTWCLIQWNLSPFRLNVECLCYSHGPREYGSRDIMQLPRRVLKRFFTFCFYSLGMLPSHKGDWNGSWRERGAQLSQMYQLRSDSSQPLAKCNIVLEPRQKCQQKNHLVNPWHFDTLLICCYFKFGWMFF